MKQSSDDVSREPASERLARSRAELKALFEPQPEESAAPGAQRMNGSARAGSSQGFPRSWTMRLLTKGAGTGGFAVLAAALLATSPAKAMQLLRYLPLNAITKILVSRLITARGAKK